MPETVAASPLASENNNEKAVAKVKIDLKSTKAKAPEHSKKSVDFVNLVPKDEISPPLIQVSNSNLASAATNGISNQVCFKGFECVHKAY